jgi:hypothetical protein
MGTYKVYVYYKDEDASMDIFTAIEWDVRPQDGMLSMTTGNTNRVFIMLDTVKQISVFPIKEAD